MPSSQRTDLELSEIKMKKELEIIRMTMENRSDKNFCWLLWLIWPKKVIIIEFIFPTESIRSWSEWSLTWKKILVILMWRFVIFFLFLCYSLLFKLSVNLLFSVHNISVPGIYFICSRYRLNCSAILFHLFVVFIFYYLVYTIKCSWCLMFCLLYIIICLLCLIFCS